MLKNRLIIDPVMGVLLLPILLCAASVSLCLDLGKFVLFRALPGLWRAATHTRQE